MVIKREIMFNNIKYYIIVDCIYKKECNSTFLRLKIIMIIIMMRVIYLYL